MLKITVSNTNPGTTFVLSGRLAGPWVDEFRDCWLKQEKHEPARCHVDLREVTFIDEAGTRLLSQMYRKGVTIQASGCLTKAIVQNFSDTQGCGHGVSHPTAPCRIRRRRPALRRCTMPVTLINVFSVPAAKEAEFVQWWQNVKEHITKQAGFISGTFHKSLKQDSRFNYINVAVWEKETLYWKAYEKSVTPMKEKLGMLGVEMTPALYHVAFEY